MAQATDGDVVNIHYTGTLADGTVFDSSKDREPLEFTVGTNKVIAGFEEGVLGMEVGESKTINVPVDKAYGPHSLEKIIEVERSQMPSDMNPQIDMMISGTQPGCATIKFRVVGVTETSVTLDGNHPLAGKDLTFEIQLVSIG